jgi:hypothetical protein
MTENAVQCPHCAACRCGQIPHLREEIENLKDLLAKIERGAEESATLLERLKADRTRLGGKLSALGGELSVQQEISSAAAHVVVLAGVDHELLDSCGCEECELVRSGMVNAGYLEDRSAKEGEEREERDDPNPPKDGAMLLELTRLLYNQ